MAEQVSCFISYSFVFLLETGSAAQSLSAVALFPQNLESEEMRFVVVTLG